MQTHDEALSAQDLSWLRRHARHHVADTVLGGVFFTLFFAMTAFLAWLWLSNATSIARDPVLSAMILVLAGFTLYLGRRLLRGPAARQRLRQVLRGAVPKQVVTGEVTDFVPAPGGGVRYGIDGRKLEVALPFMNGFTMPGDGGRSPDRCAARLGVPLRLHLLALWPGEAPVLLRAEYDGPGDVQKAFEALSDADRAQARNGDALLRNAFLGAALILLGGGWFLWPLYGVAALCLLAGLWVGGSSRALRRATVKYGVRGRVDEVLTYKVRTPESTSWTAVHAYRVGGELYGISHGGGPAQPGERVAFEYLDRGRKGLRPLFFRREGGAPQAAAPMIADDRARP